MAEEAKKAKIDPNLPKIFAKITSKGHDFAWNPNEKLGEKHDISFESRKTGKGSSYKGCTTDELRTIVNSLEDHSTNA